MTYKIKEQQIALQYLKGEKTLYRIAKEQKVAGMTAYSLVLRGIKSMYEEGVLITPNK